jgi:orotidine-5'-phosphate decarboxylase
VDGIVIGAPKIDIIKEISQLNETKIYSPGFITQSGSIDDAVKAGTDYLILGRHILNSSSPFDSVSLILQQIRQAKKFRRA